MTEVILKKLLAAWIILIGGILTPLEGTARPRRLLITSPMLTLPTPLTAGETQGLAVVFEGQSNGNGIDPGVTTIAPFGSQTRFPQYSPPADTAWPFPALHEGLASVTGGNPTNVESNVTAAIAELHALGGRRWIGINRSANGSASYDIDKTSVSTFVYHYTWETNGDVQRAFTARTNASLPFEVVARVLTHGETDDDAGLQAAYPTWLRTYQNDGNNDGKNRTGQSRNIPIFISQMNSGANGLGGGASTNGYMPLQQNTVAFTNPASFVLANTKIHFGNTTTNVYRTDGIHLTASGQILYGESMGLALHSVFEAGVIHRPLLPAYIAPDATGIDVDYTGRIPCLNLNSTNTPTTSCTSSNCCYGSPLVLDTTNVLLPWDGDNTNTPTYGYELECSLTTVRRPWITSVAISNSTHVRINTNRAIPPGCNLSYARYSVAGINAGNGIGTNVYGCARGNLRDSMNINGRISGQPIYTWGPTWTSTITNSGPNLSSLDVLLRDHDWTYGWDAPSGTSGVTLTDINGNTTYDLPPFAGRSWAASSPGVGVVPSTYNSITPADMNDATPGCWHQVGAGETKWDWNTTDDMWFRFIGRMERSAISTYLWYWQGDTPTNNIAYMQMVSGSGNFIFFHDGSAGGGGAMNNNTAGLISATPEWVVLDVFLEMRAGQNGNPQLTICYGSNSCVVSALGGALGDLTTGQLTLGFQSCNSASFRGHMIAQRFAFGERARAQFSQAMHARETALFCPSPPCT